MKRNYATLVSFGAFFVALPLPFFIVLTLPEQVGALGSRVGAAVYLWAILWIGAWTLIGFIAGVRGLWLSFHNCGSRWLAGVATGVNLLSFFCLEW